MPNIAIEAKLSTPFLEAAAADFSAAYDAEIDESGRTAEAAYYLNSLHAVALELNHRRDEAHEQAHRENERRWAEAAVAHVAVDDGEAIADLLVRVRRNWRLACEKFKTDFFTFRHYSVLSGAAARELGAEYDVEVAHTDGQWIVEFG